MAKGSGTTRTGSASNPRGMANGGGKSVIDNSLSRVISYIETQYKNTNHSELAKEWPSVGNIDNVDAIWVSGHGGSEFNFATARELVKDADEAQLARFLKKSNRTTSIYMDETISRVGSILAQTPLSILKEWAKDKY